MFGASKPFGGSGFGAKSTASAFGTQSTPFGGGTTGGLFGSKTPAANAFGTPNFGSSTPSSGLFGSASTGTNLFGSKTTQASTGFGGFGATSSSGGGMFGGGTSSVFQAPQTNSFFGSSGVGTSSGSTIKFAPPTSSEQAQKSGISLTIKTQNQCITVMEQYKTKCVEEIRLEDYVAGRKTGQATSAFGSTATGGTGLFGGTQVASSSGGLFGSTTTSTGGFGGFGKTSTSGSMFGQSTGGGLFGAKTTASLFGTTTTTTASAFGFGSTGGGGLFGKSSTGGTSLFGSTATTASTGLFGSTSTTGFGATSSSGGLFGGTSAFGQPASQSTGVFGQQAKPAFGFGTSTAGGFGATSTAGGLFGGTSSSGGLFGSTANKPTFSFGGTGGGFGTTGTTGGFGGFGATTSNAATGGCLFGSKPTGFGTAGFGATASSGGLFGGGTTLGASTGFGGFGAKPATGFAPTVAGGLTNVDHSLLAALQQQQLLQQQRKALANTPFGDSPLFRNLTAPAKPKIAASTTSTTAKELLNSSQYKVLSRPTTRLKPRPVSSPSLGKSHLFEGLEEEGDFSPYPLLPRKSVKKLVIRNKPLSESGSPFEEGQLKLRLRTTGDEDSVLSNESKTADLNDISLTTADKTYPFIDSISELKNHEVSTPVAPKVNNYVITPSPLSKVSIAEDIVEPEVIENDTPVVEMKSKMIFTRSEYYTKPPLSDLDKLVDEDKCECNVQGFSVGREGYGEVKFLGTTNVYGLNIDEIVTFTRKEIEVYADHYEGKPEVGKELNKPAEITLLKMWPNDKSTRTPIKTPERLKEAGFIDKIEERTAAMDAVFIDYRPKEGAWVFKVNHFTKYGMQDEFLDDTETRKKMAQGKLSSDQLSRLAESSIDFQKDDIDITKEAIKQKFKLESFQMSQDEDAQMDATVDESEMILPEREDMEEADDFLPASHQLSYCAELQPFSLQGMKSSVLFDNDDVEMAEMKVKKKKKQLFSNKSLFSSSFSEQVKPGLPFPRLDLTSVQSKDLNNTVFQNITFSQPPVENASKFQKTHIFQRGVLNTTNISAHEDQDDETPQVIRPTEERLSIKCQNFQMVPYEQSFLFAKTTLHSDAALSHGREFNIRWCNNMNLVHNGKPMGSGVVSQKKMASIFTGNFVSSSSIFALKNSKVLIESINKNASSDLKQYFDDNLQIALSNSVFEAGTHTSLEFVRLSDGVASLSDYTEKAKSYKLATISVNFPEFQMFSCIWDLISALWGKLDDDTELLYEVHAGRRDAFSKWLSNVIDSELKTDSNISREGHLPAIFSLLSANKVREACTVACNNKDIRLAFLLSQISGDFHLKNYMRNQLTLWEEREIDTYMDTNRLKIYVLLSGLMVWRSVNSSTCINICENVDWRCALALHLWYHCAPSATINDAFSEYQMAFKGTETYKSYAPFPSPSYLDKSSPDAKTKDLCYHIISLYCKREHSLEKLLCPKTYTSAPLDYHLSWHIHEVLNALGYEHLSEDKHYLLQHSYAAELELMGLWHWSVFILMHLRDDSRREKCVKDLLNRYCRVSQDGENVLALTEEENILVNKFHVPIQWLHEAKALHASTVRRHYDEALHLMRAGQWNQAHVIVMKHLTCDAIIEEDYESLKNMLSDMSLPERSCEIKNWRISGQVYLDFILTQEKLYDIQSRKVVISSYHLEDMEGDIASLINRITMIKTETSRERLCQSEMARSCSSMQKFVLSYASTDENDEAPQWSSLKVTPYVVNLPLPPDYYLKELRELLDNYANEIEQSERIV